MGRQLFDEVAENAACPIAVQSCASQHSGRGSHRLRHETKFSSIWGTVLGEKKLAGQG